MVDPAPRAPRTLRRRARGLVRDLAYSPPVRALARTVADRPALREAAEDRGRGELLARLASDAPAPGHYYARLQIRDWARHRGAQFRLRENGRIVYGNRISAPPEGTPLEYRNIPVTSADPADFTLDLPAKHTLHIGRGAFSTPEQRAYDAKYQVTRRRGLFSSVRGETATPRRLLVTFPGFPPANSRVSYAVSYLKALRPEDLEGTMMLCYQDRYGVAGTYMVHDDAGRPVLPRVIEELRTLQRRHGIADEDVLLFGASKGASIAAMVARDLPGARLVLVVPQMSLPYYATKPVLRGGLFQDRALWDVEQPGALLRRYLREERRIDYFYSDVDESSNASLIEYARDAKGLVKHRIGGAHATVAKRSMPTVLTLLRAFAAGEDPADGAPLECTELTASLHEDGADGGAAGGGAAGGSVAGGGAVSWRVQFADDSVPAGANVYLEGRLGATRVRQLLSPGKDPAARWTTAGQRTDPALHPAEFTHVLAYDGTTEARRGTLPPATAPTAAAPSADASAAATSGGTAGTDRHTDAHTAPSAAPEDPARHPATAPEPLTCDAPEPREYAALAAAGVPSARWRYLATRLAAGGDHAEVQLLPALPARVDGTVPHADGPAVRFQIEAIGAWRDLELLLRRLAVTARTEHLRVLVTDPAVPDGQLAALDALDWPFLLLEDHRRS